jgi:hypothetical protein
MKKEKKLTKFLRLGARLRALDAARRELVFVVVDIVH